MFSKSKHQKRKYYFCYNKSLLVLVLTFKFTAVTNISTQNVYVTVIQFKSKLLVFTSGDVLLNPVFKFILCFSGLIKVVLAFVHCFSFHFKLYKMKQNVLWLILHFRRLQGRNKIILLRVESFFMENLISGMQLMRSIDLERRFYGNYE